jgi:hypothetical protein
MATNRLHRNPRAARRCTTVLVAVVLALIAIEAERRAPRTVTEQETHYDVETPADEYHEGAEVFAAGAFSLAWFVWEPDVRPLMENLWARLSQD